jgi:hypothetical protein
MMSTMFVEMKKGVSVDDLRQHLVDRFQVNCISLEYTFFAISSSFSLLNSTSVLLENVRSSTTSNAHLRFYGFLSDLCCKNSNFSLRIMYVKFLFGSGAG